jgi:L,D-transpeptidase ErfK/SrfK
LRESEHRDAWAANALTLSTRIPRVSALASTLAMLAGCTAIDDFVMPLEESAPPVVELTPPEERPRLEPLNATTFVLESADQTVIGEPQIVFTSEENTFSDLAREYGLGYDELVEANPDVDPWLPGEQTPVVLPTQFVLPDVPREGIVLNIASKRLFYFPTPEEGEPQTVMTYPIGIGRVGWQTPLGSSAVVSKARDPHWYVPASVRREHEEMGDPLPAVVPPGPENPLGRHVLKLGIPGYLIHGTNQPYGVGMRVSHGCVRLYPENIEVLFSVAEIGETVRIVNQPYLVGRLNGQTLIQIHAPLEDDTASPDERRALLLQDERLDNGQEDFDVDAYLSRPTSIATPLGAGPIENALANGRVVRNTVETDPGQPTLEEVRAILDGSAAGEALADNVADE